MGNMKELTVWLENKPGTLAAMAEALGKAKVNILAFMTDEAEGQSRVRLVTDKPAKAIKTMAGLNLQASEEEVVGVTLANKPGTRCRMPQANSEVQASISTTATPGQKKARRSSWLCLPCAI